jgi:aminoglycoside phosphotransferase (APT) family kinase protein
MAMHRGQLDVTVQVVRALIDAQFPQWRHLEITPVVSSGTVNALFRMGEGLVARFPLVGEDADATRRSLETEARAAAELAECAPIRTPVTVAIGSPGPGYPLPWSVQTWVPGTPATDDDPGASTAFAQDLAAFITALRSMDTRGRSFSGSGRGGGLRDHDDWMETCFRASQGLVDVPNLRRLWRDLRTLPGVGPDVMAHGDLIPGNVLVEAGRLVGVIDVGGFGPADRALDLVSAWHLLDDEPRQHLRSLLGCDALEWARGMAWALEQAMGVVWYYAESNPPMSQMGHRTLQRILSTGRE